MTEYIRIGNYIGGLTGTWTGPVLANANEVYLIQLQSGNRDGSLGIGTVMGGGLLAAGIEAAVRAAAPARDPAAAIGTLCKLSDLAGRTGWPLQPSEMFKRRTNREKDCDVLVVQKPELSLRKAFLINRPMLNIGGRDYKVDHVPFTWRRIRREPESIGWVIG